MSVDTTDGTITKRRSLCTENKDLKATVMDAASERTAAGGKRCTWLNSELTLALATSKYWPWEFVPISDSFLLLEKRLVCIYTTVSFKLALNINLTQPGITWKESFN